MRIELTMRPMEKDTVVPVNYQYPISSAIYKILMSASEEYATWLHDKGYTSSDGKPMKLFVFSKLDTYRKSSVRGNLMMIPGYSPCTLYISSPMLEDFVENFVTGLFQQQEFAIGNRQTVGRFHVESVNALCPPDLYRMPPFSSDAWIQFRALSPIVLSSMRDYRGKRSQCYLLPDDSNISEAIRKNLVEKFCLIAHCPPTDDRLEVRLDEGYVSSRGGYDNLTKMVTICEGDKTRETKIRGFIAPLQMRGSIGLMQCAYECGVGEKNSLGFGMIERD